MVIREAGVDDRTGKWPVRGRIDPGEDTGAERFALRRPQVEAGVIPRPVPTAAAAAMANRRTDSRVQ